MKLMMSFAMVAVFALTGCGVKKDKPTVGADKGGSQKTAPTLPATPATPVVFALDGTWVTPCLNSAIQTVYSPYVATVHSVNGGFYVEWNSYSDEDCKVVNGDPDFTRLFLFTIGADISSGVKAFDYTWTYQDAAGKDQPGKEFNIISIASDKLHFFPLYASANDEFDGSTAAKRFKAFTSKQLGFEEVYSRVK